MGGTFLGGASHSRIGQATSAGLDRALEIDRRFFDRHAGRRHRIRRATRAEIDGLEAAYGRGVVRLRAGERWFAVIRQLAPGAWLKAFLPAPADNETDVPEAWAAALYERLASRMPGSAELEAATLAVTMRGAR